MFSTWGREEDEGGEAGAGVEVWEREGGKKEGEEGVEGRKVA